MCVVSKPFTRWVNSPISPVFHYHQEEKMNKSIQAKLDADKKVSSGGVAR